MCENCEKLDAAIKKLDATAEPSKIPRKHPEVDWYTIGYEEGVSGLPLNPPMEGDVITAEDSEFYAIGWYDGEGERTLA